jgi:hypothetical protein
MIKKQASFGFTNRQSLKNQDPDLFAAAVSDAGISVDKRMIKKRAIYSLDTVPTYQMNQRLVGIYELNFLAFLDMPIP